MIKNCLLESTLNEIKEIESLDYSFVKADEDFKARIKNDIEKRKTLSKSRKLILILVATLVVCCCIAFSASADIRNSILSFFVEAHQSYSDITFENVNPNNCPKVIETEYQSSYFEEKGYKPSQKNVFSWLTTTEWTIGSRKVTFSQSTIDENVFITINTEDGIYDTVIGDYKVYYTKNSALYSVYWIQDGYFFRLHCCPGMDLDDAEEIILSTGPLTP